MVQRSKNIDMLAVNERIRSLQQQGLTVEVIAKAIGKSVRMVHYYLNSQGIIDKAALILLKDLEIIFEEIKNLNHKDPAKNIQNKDVIKQVSKRQRSKLSSVALRMIKERFDQTQTKPNL